MSLFLMSVALFLLANLLLALFVATRGPTAADPMLTALLFGSTGIGILALLAGAADMPALVDVALVLALLAAVSGLAFARRAWHKPGSRDD